MKTKILLSVISSLFFLSVLEIILRIVNIGWDINVLYRRRDLEWQEKYVTLNSYGYRDKEYSKDRTENSLRIYALGDSYTFGWLIDNPKSSYPKILEDKLSKNLSKKVEVINAGTPGLSISEEVDRYRLEGIQYNPDLVLLALMDDEALVSHKYFERKDEFLPKFIKESRAYNVTFGSVFKKISEKENHDYLVNIYRDKNSKDWKEFERKILSLKEEVEKNNASLAIILYPHIHPNQPNLSYDLYPYNKKFEEFGKKNNIAIIDPLDKFLKYNNKEKLVINPADAHPTGEMNKLIVEELLEKINFQKFILKERNIASKSLIISLTRDTSSIGKYKFIKGIKNKKNEEEFPWVYYETKNDTISMLQDFVLEDLKFRQTSYNVDRLQIAKNFLGVVGADIIYYLKPQSKNQIILSEKIYGYPIIGINYIFATYVVKGNNLGDFVDPKELKFENKKIIVNFDAKENYRLFKINLKVGVKKIDINPSGKIENIERTVKVNKKAQENSNNLNIELANKRYGIPEFYNGVKKIPYVFVDNKFKRLEKVSLGENNILLTFRESLKKGEEVKFYTGMNYTLGNGEIVELEIEYEND